MSKAFANPQINDVSELGCTSTQEDTEPKSALATAISLWRAGKRIDLTLFAELREEGYDVPSLERFYFNQSSR